MKRTISTLLPLLVCTWAAAQEIGPLTLEGAIAGEHLTVEMRRSVKDLSAGEPLEVRDGTVALLEDRLPPGVRLEPSGTKLSLLLERGRWRSRVSGDVMLRFAPLQRAEGERQSVRFAVPVTASRTIAVTCDRPGLEVEIPCASGVARGKAADGSDRVSGYLGFSPQVTLAWKAAVRKLDAELIASCDALTAVTVAPGTARLKTQLTYRVAQGELTNMVVEVPGLAVIQVSGQDLRDWSVDKRDPAKPRLRVALGRPQRDSYRLDLECEQAIPAFPCEFKVETPAPQQVIRSSGLLLLGTDSAVRLQVGALSGLTQTDPAAFPRQALGAAAPARCVTAYQHAAMPCGFTLKAEDIVPALSAETSLLCKMEEGLLTVEANVQLEVRDAPVREVRLATDADASWTVASVSGQQVAESDVDVRTAAGGREIVVPFRKPLEGSAVVALRLERSLSPGGESFSVPSLSVADARAQRGYVVAAAARGIRLSAKAASGLSEVHTASTPLRAEGAQLAYRFREGGWSLAVGVERAKSSLHAELFHLVSLGEGVAYISTAVTCHISGAPVQSLAFRIPEGIGLIDVTGANIDAWARDKDLCTVKLQSRVIGDYTLLITYDRPLNYRGGELRVGEIEMAEAESELGYLAVATAASLKLEEADGMPATLIRIGRDEIPAGYAATVTAPVIGAYKYVRRPHAATLKVTPYATEGLLGQVADYVTLSTRLARNCESVTKAVYSVKNAARQYLSLKLPAAATLWSVRQLADDGAGRDLPAQQDGGVLLVPVERPRDPNRAVTIEVVYALAGAKGRRTATLEAPVLTGAPVTFASWSVEAGDKVGISRAESNLSPEAAGSGFKLPVFNRQSARVRRFYRTANLADEAPLQVAVTLVPAWLAGGSLGVLGGGAAAGALALLAAAVRRRKLWLALGLTCLGVAAAQIEAGLLAACAALAIAVPALALAGVVRVCARLLRGRRRADAAPAEAEAPPLVDEPAAPSAGGFVRLGLLLALAGLSLAAASPADEPIAQQEASPAEAEFASGQGGLRVSDEKVAVSVEARAETREAVAAVVRTLTFAAERAGVFRLLRADDTNRPALVAFADHANAKVSADAAGVLLTIKRPGEYALRIETRETAAADGAEPVRFTWASFGGLKSETEVDLPSAELAVEGVGIAQLTCAPANGRTAVRGVLTTGTRRFGVAYRPRVRDARKEAAAVYCDIAALAHLRAGVVDIDAQASYTVAQGELREVRLKVPAGMGVVSVTASGLASWSLDPATRLLTAVFERPQTGALALRLGLQCACGGLPYAVKLGALAAEGVQRQRGYLALAAAETVLLKAEAEQGVAAMNVADYPLAAGDPAARPADEPIRRAYRYEDAAAVEVAYRAEAVQPEVRVVESSAFSIGDERCVLSAKLEITIAKAGLFSLRLEPPAGYEIETLSGAGVSHWDDARKAGGGVDVYFSSRLLGSTALNVVLARQQRGVDARVTVPRLAVAGALRHTGRLAVTAERGVRLALDEQQGLSVVREEAPRAGAGALTFDILRPGWQAELKTQVLQPVLKPELLHRVDLSEGMLQHRIYARYKIENAGVKTFRVAVPVKDATLTVSGRNVARVQPEGEAAADGSRVWAIELHGKVEEAYAFTALYQEPYDPAAGGVRIRPFGTPGAARQAAWIVVTGGGRVQVEPRGEPAGLRAEDARSLPDAFGAGDLSGALRCYRALQPDYALELSVVRHEAAQVLPAGVESARFTTVLSASGKMLTQAQIELRTGRLRFLKVGLPPSSALWAAQVNGTEVAVSRDGEGHVNIPLELLASEQVTAIALVYADSLPGALGRSVEIPALRLPDLPLQNIRWSVYAPPGAAYRLANRDFDEEAPAAAEPGGSALRTFGRSEYLDANRKQGTRNLSEAKRSLGNVGALLDKGDRLQAQKALQQAVSLSQAEQTLNEDARVQFRNVVREQVKIGLVNRREALRLDNNIFDEQAPQTQAGYNGGNFSRDFASRVEEQLSASDRASLDRVALKIVEQQAAAAGQGAAISIAMPEHGRLLSYARALQNECGGALVLSLRATDVEAWRAALAWWPALPLFLGLWALLRFAFGPRREKVA